MDKKALLDSLKVDLKASEQMHDTWESKRQQWANEHDGKPYGNEQDGKSRIISRDIKKQSEWLHANLVDPFVSSSDIIKASPVTWEDKKAAQQNELILNTQFCRQFNRYNFMTKSAKVLDREGTVVVQTGWDYEYDEILIEADTIVIDENGIEQIETIETTEIKVTKNQPTAVVCRSEDIFIDPTCKDDMDKCQFVIHRYETDISTLIQDGRYKNLDKINVNSDTDSDASYVAEDTTRFRFEDDPRKKLLVYEYWGNYDVNEDGIAEPIVCAWIEDTIIRLQTNPYPDNKPPFLVVPFNSVPFQLFGESNAEILSDTQKVKTAITRGIIDNMAQSNNGQKGIKKGALDAANRKKFLAGQNFEYNTTSNDFWDGSYNQIPRSAFDMLALLNNEIESVTGIKSFSGGINSGSLGSLIDINESIPMFDGTFKLNGDLIDGDIIIGSNGKGTTVIKAHEIKKPKVSYRMDFSNGATIKAGGEHLWTVKVDGSTRKLSEWHTVDTNTVYNYINKYRKVYIPRINRVDMVGPISTKIDAYCLGFWLGDGNSHKASITTEDTAVVDSFISAGYPISVSKHQTPDSKGVTYDISSSDGNVKNSINGQFICNEDTFHGQLKSLSLLKRYTNKDKFIPDEYFSAPYNVKLELVRGLMDSDGYAHSGAFNTFCQSEGQLKDDFIRLIYSMGATPRISKHTTASELNRRKAASASGLDIVSKKDMYEIGFTLLDNPFRLARKANKWKAPTRINTIAITKIKIVKNVLMRCLTVDSKDSLYAVGKAMTLTHNTATGARGALDATSTRRLNIVRNISENLVKPLLRKWMAYNSEFLSEKEVIRITNSEFVEIKRDDLLGNIDIDIQVSTAEDNASKAQELAFMLQTLGPSAEPEERRMIQAEIATLQKMPDLAHNLLNYKPDPEQARMQQEEHQIEMQKRMLENKKLEAEIHGLYRAASEDEADAMEKASQARHKDAQTGKIIAETNLLGSKKDNEDLAFIEKDEEVSHRHALELKEQDRLRSLDELALQHQLGDKALGVSNA